MRAEIKFMLKRIVRVSLHVLWAIPVDRRKMFFSSYHGRQYSCNPKYLYEHLVQEGMASRYKVVWELAGTPPDAPALSHSETVAPRSLRGAVQCMTSRYIVTNHEFPWWIPLRRGQVLLQTWHGGGAYKKVGLEAGWGRLADCEQKLNSRQITFYLSSCRKFTEIQSRSKCVPEQRFLPTGMPRNAIFFLSRPELRGRVFASLGIDDPNAKLALYAPTYRGRASFNRSQSCDALGEDLDFSGLVAALQDRFGGKWICAYRGHYYNAGPQGTGARAVDATSYGDMQELLYVADALVTDYSSSIWDFALTGRPMFLFAPDYDSYRRERDFYTPVEEWPPLLATSNGELRRNILAFDSAGHQARCREHLGSLGSYEDARSCTLVWEAVGVPERQGQGAMA